MQKRLQVLVKCNKVVLLRQLVATVIGHDKIDVTIRISLSRCGTVLSVFLIARNITVVGVDLSQSRGGIAQDMSVIDVRKLASLVSAVATAGILRALEDMTVLTLRIGTIAVARERRTDGSGRGYFDVRIAACIIRAVAAKEMKARGHALVGDGVTEVAEVTGRTLVLEEGLADGDLFWIVGEVARLTVRAFTCA